MKKIATAFLLALSVFFILGVPFTKWGFKTDDWANIFHSKLASWQQAAELFYEGNMESINHPSGTAPDRGSFLSGLYRPLSFIYYYPQTLIFKTEAYGYFLMTVLFHACNTGLFFLILSYFFNFYIALAGAAWFGFHPSLQNWLGWISAQTYFIELLILGFVFSSFYMWLRTKKAKWYCLSLSLFFINLLLKEASIVLPCWVFIATYLHIPSHGLHRLRQSIKAATGYCCAAIAYLLIRLSVMPFSHEVGTLGFKLTWSSFITKQIARSMQFLTYVYDVLGLTWLPKGNRLLNGSILIIILALFFMLFVKSKHKKTIVFCCFSTILFSWPGLIMHYQPRYMYMALPWCIGSLLFLAESIKSHKVKKLLGLFCLVGCLGSSAYIFANMKERETALHIIDSSMRRLVTQTLPTAGWNNEALCFFGLPQHWFDMGTAQAIWFLRGTNSFPVYQLGYPISMPSNDNPRAIPKSNNISINVINTNGEIEIKSSDHDYFVIEKNINKSSCRFGVNPALREKRLFLITWDYEKAALKVVGILDAIK